MTITTGDNDVHNNKLVALAIGVLALTACHSDKNPSKNDFAKVIQKSIQGQCGAFLPFHSLLGQEGNPFPQSMELGSHGSSTAQDDDDALVRAGLLRAQDVKSPSSKDIWKPGEVTTRTYSLTNLGKQQFSFVDSKTIFGGTVKRGLFCVTTYKVDEVTNFTVPAQNALTGIGSLTSEVFYTYSPDKVSDWAKSDAIQAAFPEIKQKLSMGQRGDALLVLTNDGWMNNTDLK